MERRLTIEDYLGGEETNRPQELTYGILREPPAPGYNHQVIVGRLYVPLDAHVRAEKLGRVILSPIDVILDPAQALVVQPDLAFVSAARMNICSERIWGAPDLAIEVLSTFNRRHDRSVKVGWYREYGVRECWIVDPVARTIDVIDTSSATSLPRGFEGDVLVRSAVLPRLRLRAESAFAD
jgi:Uma2 family endonuclease